MSRSGPISLALAAIVLATPARAGDVPAGAATEDAPIAWREPILYSLSGMGIGIVALVASRQGDDDPSFGNFTDAFSDGPRRDDDGPLYNFVLHPLWGSETYLRAREANLGPLGSFGFSLGASVTWEYLIESWTEHPSTQDLILTTGLGWMLGELRYQLKQRMPEEEHWWVDPVHEALEHWGIGVTDADSGRPRPRLNLSYRF